MVVWCHSRARPKSVIFRVFPLRWSPSSGSRMRTEEEEEEEEREEEEEERDETSL